MKDCSYVINLKKYDVNELIRSGPFSGPHKNINWSEYISEVTEYFLVIDITQQIEESLVAGLFIGNSRELNIIFLSILRALRLHCSKGLVSSMTYSFNNLTPGLSFSTNLLNQYFFSFGPDNSVLDSSSFNSLKKTIEILINKTWDMKNTFDKLLRLALDYHKVVFDLEMSEHSFLILMVIFESLFKKELNNNASQASKIISKLLSNTKSAQPKIHKDFFDKVPESFCNIRNSIAHGDPFFDRKILELKHPSLLKYISQAIISLLCIPAGEIDPNKDFYDEIFKFVNKHFLTLPDN